MEVWAAIGVLAAYAFGSTWYLSAKIDSRTDALSSRLDGLGARMDAGFQAVNAEFQAVSARMDAGFQSVNGRLDHLSERVARLEASADLDR